MSQVGYFKVFVADLARAQSFDQAAFGCHSVRCRSLTRT